MSPFKPTPFRVALLAVILCFSWQCLTVHFNYHDNWTGLFFAGANFPPPPEALRSEQIYRLPNSFGYDGQVYHLIAHDPVLARRFDSQVDAPRLRWRRILVPGLAWFLAMGQDGWIDRAYLIVILAFIGMGTFWLAQLIQAYGHSYWWALGFVLTPGAFVSLDRMTTDVALAACCCGYVWYLRDEGHPLKLWMVLLLAALSRETGFLLIGGVAASVIWAGRFRLAALYLTSGLPALGWYAFVHLHTASQDTGFLGSVPFFGFVNRLLHPYPYTTNPLIGLLAQVADVMALGAVALALGFTAVRFYRRQITPVTAAMVLFSVLTALLVKDDAWLEVYAFGRTLTPLLVLTALDGLPSRPLLACLTVLLMTPRLVLQIGSQILGVLHGLI